jgi:hypothetical protein
MQIEKLTPKEINFICFFCNEKIGNGFYRNKTDLKYLNMESFFTLLKKSLYKLTKDTQIIAKNLILKK